MSKEVSLSYILTTYNKIDYLKITLPLLIKACNTDEEIIVVDGGSKDGSIDFLTELYSQKKIHQFISEKDFGEAHGTNKAMLMAKGQLIKLISDDDIYDFKVIAEYKNYMMSNPKTDLIAGHVLQHFISKSSKTKILFSKQPELEYLEWKNKQIPNFFFCGLTIMFRKSSLPLLGLFNTCVKLIDIEYAVRVSTSGAIIKFNTKAVALAIVNESSNTNHYTKLFETEKLKVALMYNYFPPYLKGNYFYNPFSLKQVVKYLLFRIFKKKKAPNIFRNEEYEIDYATAPGINIYEKAHHECSIFLETFNRKIGKTTHEFI